ncbi:hypothetical protein SNE40_010392 [Patella caerulea]|uniref:Spermatogenesis-associated protein 7 n=2 Tax=Patella caerulea TaxID=87958 RepID=A0AAN8PSS9_PATCE
MNSITALKGNLGLRSSPLSPTSSKLSTQYLVLDHMASHYKKISKAKSAIDSGRPKSMVCSQKARDNQRRKNISQGLPSRTTSQMSRHTPSPNHYRYTTDEHYDNALWDEELEDEDDRLVQSIMRTTLQTKPNPSHHATFNTNNAEHHYHQQDVYDSRNFETTRPVSQRSMLSSASRLKMALAATKGPNDGDILEKRKEVFNQPEKPFTPRTLKTDRKSRLSEYKYYTPPKKNKNKNQETSREKQIDNPNKEKIDNRPKAKPRKQSSQFQPENTMSSTMMRESFQTRDFSNNYNKSNADVPPLDITVDNDHRNWLEEQAGKAEHRREKAPHILHSNINDDGTSQYIQDEEQKYVDFAHGITKDIISRGVYTDRMLKQVFNEHFERRKHDLDLVKMKRELDKLRCELDLHPEVGNKKDYVDTRHNIHFTNEPYLGRTAEIDTIHQNSTTRYHTNTADIHTMPPNTSSYLEETADHCKNETAGYLEKTTNNETKNNDLEKTAISDESNGYFGKTSDSNRPNSRTANSRTRWSIDSTNTLNFNSTKGELLSTIQSDNIEGDNDDLTSTQILDQYQTMMTMKAKDGEETDSQYQSSQSRQSPDSSKHHVISDNMKTLKETSVHQTADEYEDYNAEYEDDYDTDHDTAKHDSSDDDF